MLNIVKRLMVEEEGQGLTEYALVLGVIAVACIGIIAAFGTQITQAWTSIQQNLGNKLPGATPQ
ncbi:Flp family type IVb pilin [Candidatus Clostridium radicumherbarum]|uniref:Flp family type IVb pilin n=1 Tax=Candidatus Clostridium radicumherbarum TaxID=3381662 RepID=A0ABW8TPR3_9CLOT